MDSPTTPAPVFQQIKNEIKSIEYFLYNLFGNLN